MGAFLTNIVLCGPTQNEVVAELRAQKRSAFISPTIGGKTVVFDRESERQGEALTDLALALSTKFRCAALAVVVHDSDILLLSLFESGRPTDDYNSAPSYFDEDGDPDEPPEGGDAANLCRAMGAGNAADLERILRASSTTDYVFEEERLAAIGRVLNLPPFVPMVGYNYLQEASSDPGLGDEIDLSSMIRTP